VPLAGAWRFSGTRLDEVRAFQAFAGFQLAPLAHTDAVNVRLNRLEGRIRRHSHPHTDHFVYVIKGQIDLTVDQQRQRIGAGDLVVIPRGTPHAMQRVGAAAALFLDIAAPPDVGDVLWQE
jgi:quercetin dioxygenase-like cupin family protein